MKYEFTPNEIYISNQEAVLKQMVKITAEESIKYLRSITPVSKRSGGKYGHLKDNWTYTMVLEKSGWKAYIWGGEKSFVVHFLEYGTSKAPPHPVLAPTNTEAKKYLQKNSEHIDFEFKTK